MPTILVTGAAGNLGRGVVKRLAERDCQLIATDIRPPPAVPGVWAEVLDIRSPELVELLRRHRVEVVVHLAAVVNPPPGMSRSELFDIEVGGTRNLIEACTAAGVRRLVYTSSGAAYGYHPDNAALLFEDHPLRGNEAFAYAWHKRAIEDLLAMWRTEHPELGQLIFRVCTVLGPTVHNQITALFERPVVVGLRGADTPFCFVDLDDVHTCLVQGALGEHTGVYNLTGDGVMTLREVASAMGGRYLPLPERAVRRGLEVMHRRGWAPYGPEQVMFLRHRPVLANRRLETELGFRPHTSRQAFARYRDARVSL